MTSAYRETIIEVRGLRKRYGDREVLGGVDLRIARGEVYALLGPNGAGKTTAVEILEGFRSRDDGEVSVLGRDPTRLRSEDRARVGVVLQDGGVEPHLSVVEVVSLTAAWYPRPRDAEETLALVGLSAAAGTRVRRLSGGQRRRLELALALVGRPELLFLDEPTTGFDPEARRATWDRVRSLAAEGVTVLLTTHALDEAEALADRVGLLVGGRLVAEGTPAEVRERVPHPVTIRFRLPRGAPPLPARVPTSVSPEAPAAAGWSMVETSDPLPVLHALTAWALEHGVELASLEVAQPTLEDAYRALARTPPSAAAAEEEVRG